MDILHHHFGPDLDPLSPPPFYQGFKMFQNNTRGDLDSLSASLEDGTFTDGILSASSRPRVT